MFCHWKFLCTAKPKNIFFLIFLKNDIERYLKNSVLNRIKNCPTL